jgi:short-subunit dehydrogenase
LKKAIVIGVSLGIGRELAVILSQNGYIVGVMARRIHLLNELRQENKNIAYTCEIDVADNERAMSILSKFISEMREVDLVVISSGFGEINDALDWDIEKETIMTNVTGFAALANVAIHHFLKRGSGHLVGISSIAAIRGGWASFGI